MISNRKIIFLLIAMLLLQFLFLWIPLGSDGIHGNAFMGSECVIHPKNLENVVSLGAAAMGLTLLSLFKMKNPAYFGFTLIMIAALNVMMITQLTEYITFHNNVCHSIPGTSEASDCSGADIKYGITRWMPALTIVIAITTIFVDIYARKSKPNA